MATANNTIGTLLNEHDVARITGLSVASVRRWRLFRQGPKYLRIGAVVRYQPEDISARLESYPSGGGRQAEAREMADSAIIFASGEVSSYYTARVPHLKQRRPAEWPSNLPEGEKDVQTMEGCGPVASCNPGGSGNSHLYAGWAEYFRDRHIVILPDNDGPGRKHAAAVAAALLSEAASVRIVELPALPAKSDVTDRRDAGGTFERYREICFGCCYHRRITDAFPIKGAR